MSGPGGTKAVGRVAALIVTALLAGGMAACAYEDDGDALSTAAARTARPAPSVQSKGPDVLAVESRNYADLEKRLAGATGTVVLSDSGPADGPGVGFSKIATVKAGGAHTVTAACVGTPGVQMFLSQDPRTGAEPLSFDLECSGTLRRVVELQAGYVVADLIRHDPNGPWTGAVAGIRITVECQHNAPKGSC